MRKRHCYIIIEPDGQKCWRWVDIVTAKPNPMYKSLQWRRRNALGDVTQLAQPTEANPDVLTLDLTMPGGGGLKILEGLRQSCPHTAAPF